MTPLTTLDRFAIEDLFSIYHWALDTADVEGFVDTLVDDAVVVLKIGDRTSHYEGRAGMVDVAESLRVWDRFPGCQHFADQLLIEPLADTGERRCQVRSFLLVAECRGEPPYSLRFAGRSDDRLVFRGGQWLFEQRLVRLWQSDALCNRQLELS